MHLSEHAMPQFYKGTTSAAQSLAVAKGTSTFGNLEARAAGGWQRAASEDSSFDVALSEEQCLCLFGESIGMLDFHSTNKMRYLLG